MQPVLDGGGDAGLVRAVERHGRAAVGDGHGGVPVPGQQGGAAGRGGPEREPGTAPGDDGTAGGRGALPCGGLVDGLAHVRLPLAYLTTAAASLESGSASALTPSESSLRSGLPTFSYEVKT